jgi:virginiamycin B lyase
VVAAAGLAAVVVAARAGEGSSATRPPRGAASIEEAIVLEKNALAHLESDPNTARKELVSAANELGQARAAGLPKSADVDIRQALTKDENASTLVGTPNAGLVRTQLAGALNRKEAAMKVLGVVPQAPPKVSVVSVPPIKPVPPPPKGKPKKPPVAANRIAVATLVSAAMSYEDDAADADDDGNFRAEVRALGHSRDRLLAALRIADSDPTLAGVAEQIRDALDHDDHAYAIWVGWSRDCLDCQLEAAYGHKGNALDELLPTSPLVDAIGGGPDEFATDQRFASNGLWFTRALANQIAFVNVITRGLSVFPVPTAGSGPEGATIGPDGSIWFVELNAGKIGRFTPGGGFQEFTLPNPTSAPEQITSGSDGSLWFTELNNNAIGRITVDGKVTEFPLPHTGSFPISITWDPLGALYFTEGAGRIGSMSTTGSLRWEVTLPGDTFPTSITRIGTRLFFTEPHANAIGSIGTNGQGLQTYPIPTRGAFPLTITPAWDKRSLWFSERGANQLGRITLGGSISERTIPSTRPLDIVGVTSGPDWHVWWSGFESGTIGSIAQ